MDGSFIDSFRSLPDAFHAPHVNRSGPGAEGLDAEVFSGRIHDAGDRLPAAVDEDLDDRFVEEDMDADRLLLAFRPGLEVSPEDIDAARRDADLERARQN